MEQNDLDLEGPIFEHQRMNLLDNGREGTILIPESRDVERSGD